MIMFACAHLPNLNSCCVIDVCFLVQRTVSGARSPLVTSPLGRMLMRVWQRRRAAGPRSPCLRDTSGWQCDQPLIRWAAELMMVLSTREIVVPSCSWLGVYAGDPMMELSGVSSGEWWCHVLDGAASRQGMLYVLLCALFLEAHGSGAAADPCGFRASNRAFLSHNACMVSASHLIS
jgi:hypothetical protein